MGRPRSSNVFDDMDTTTFEGQVHEVNATLAAVFSNLLSPSPSAWEHKREDPVANLLFAVFVWLTAIDLAWFLYYLMTRV